MAAGASAGSPPRGPFGVRRPLLFALAPYRLVIVTAWKVRIAQTADEKLRARRYAGRRAQRFMPLPAVPQHGRCSVG